ncbi:hypothetical protein DSLASN_48950 [Desulfoluna limicola]|uniref:Prepilin-type N-terminal cleavage/methylation domain-containing protein n=1 Tax=Desulfoluna limicola TaxID=2810562 RepID=A0ABM7PPX5_9BACT|nr:prepilin-type N-terminal cleavage/methylation domain-containing protein [Desulfoluna limicola]BCS99263.1 hypothetical protein DSLASN_48950 [Desulfoluna limicola]
MGTLKKETLSSVIKLQGSLNERGFTLIEILVALVMGVIFFTAICALVIDQTQTHEDHQMKVMMQQNGRAALAVLSNEMKLAGYSPIPRSDGGSGRLATFQVAGITAMECTYDTSSNGSIELKSGASNSYNERTVLSFNPVTRQLQRNNNTNAFLNNVEAFRILYAYDADDPGAGADKYGVLERDSSTGRVIWGYDDDPTDGDNRLTKFYTFDDEWKVRTLPATPATPAIPAIPAQPGAGPGGTTIPAVPAIPAQPARPARPEPPSDLTDNPPTFDRIRAAKIWLLMRSNKRKNKDGVEILPDSVPLYTTQLDTDNFSYRLYTTTVKFRNMYY